MASTSQSVKQQLHIKFKQLVTTGMLDAPTTELEPRRMSTLVFEQLVQSVLGDDVDKYVKQHGVPEYNITDTTIQSGDVVQFTGMVQDVFDQQLYLFRYGMKLDKTAMFEDDVRVEEHEREHVHAGMMDIRPQHLAERVPAYLVSLPGRSEWTLNKAMSKEELPQKIVSTSQKKRSLDEMGDMDGMDGMEDMNEHGPLTGAHDSGNPKNSSLSTPSSSKQTRMDGPSTKLPSAAPATSPLSQPASHGSSMGLNLPLMEDAAEKQASGLVIKVYHSADFDKLLLNQCTRVVGIIEYPQHHPHEEGGMMSVDDELLMDGEQNLSLIGLPILHVMDLQILSDAQVHPALSNLHVSISEAYHELASHLPALRSMILSYLSNGLGGDQLAAEYLLMALLSRVQSRNPSVVTGKCVVNLVLPSATSSISFKSLHKMIESLIPWVATVCVRIDSLNASSLIPTRDHQCNRLQSSRLQLFNSTVLLADETGLSSGQLNERGVKNVQALEMLSQQQTVVYDFVYHQMELPVDIPLIIVSKGSKSMIAADFCVHVTPDSTTNLVGMESTPEVALQKMRLALALLTRKDMNFDIDLLVNEKIEQYFVLLRRQQYAVATSSPSSRNGMKNDPVEKLNEALILGRMVCKSVCSNILDSERWQQVLDLETSRYSRFALHSSSHGA